MKKILKMSTVWFMAVCMILGLVPLSAAASATAKAPIQALRLKNTKTTLMAGSTYTFDELFDYSIEYDPSFPPLSDLEKAFAAAGLDSTDILSLLESAISSIGKDFRTMSCEDLLGLTAAEMDDVITYIFAGLRALGVDVDPQYEKLSSSKLLKWLLQIVSPTYMCKSADGLACSPDDTEPAFPFDEFLDPSNKSDPSFPSLSDLEKAFAAAGLDSTDILSLLESAISSIGKDFRTMSCEDLLGLTAAEMDDVITYIFAGLRALGVDVDSQYEKLSSSKLLEWFLQIVSLPYKSRDLLICSPENAVSIDHVNRTVTVHKNKATPQKVTFTLTVYGADCSCASVSFDATIYPTVETAIELLGVFVQELCHLHPLKAFVALKEVFTCLYYIFIPTGGIFPPNKQIAN